MLNDFEKWNKLKQKINQNDRVIYAHKREVWWCSLGQNIGVEINGKNQGYERPVLIVATYNKEQMLVLPITSKEKGEQFHYLIKAAENNVWVSLTQPRVISSKRLLRKVDVVSKNDFKNIVKRFKEFI